jgi:hypothetical protein
MGKLFNRQTIHETYGFQMFMSDIDAYLLEMQGLDSGFDFPYPIYFGLAKLFLPLTGLEAAATISVTALNTLAVIILFAELLGTLGNTAFYGSGKGSADEKMPAGASVLKGALLVALGFSVFFVSMLYAPKGVYLPGMDHKYLGVYTPNPFHNQTYMATRPFNIAAMFAYSRLMDPELKDKRITNGLLFSLWLLLGTLAKPSFTLAFGSMAFVSLMVRLIREKGKNVREIFLIGCTFLPTVAVLLIQFGGVFGPSSHAGEAGGIGFGFFSAWKVYMTNIPLAILFGTAFPLWMLIWNAGRMKDHVFYRLSMGLLLTGFLEFAFLFEKGDRFIHMNFCWGYMHGLFFAFLACSMLLFENTLLKKQKAWILCTEWLAFGAHLFCGVIYFLFINSGGFYYNF